MTYLVPLLAGVVGLVVGFELCCLVAGRSRGGTLRSWGGPWRAVGALLCGLSFAALSLSYGPTLQALELCVFAALLLGLALSDLDRFELPNPLVAAALVVRLAYLVLACALGWMPVVVVGYYLMSALGVAVALLVTVLVADWLLGGESMGGGDLKLFAVAALYVGWEQSLVLIALACVFGIASTLVLRGLTSRSHASGLTTFPFGPSIALAIMVVLLCGDAILASYR